MVQNSSTVPPEKPIPPTYQDWVRAVRERDVERVKPKKRRSGY